MNKQDGGPAFPHQHDVVFYDATKPEEPARTIRGMWDGGMTLRDFFAAQGLARYAASYCDVTDVDFGEVARRCYDLADAMLKARTE